MATLRIPTMQGGTQEATVRTFTDSGSTTISGDGLWLIEVTDGHSEVCGGALFVAGRTWSGLLVYGTRGTAPVPTFTDSGTGTLTVATAGATGQTITVRARRPCMSAIVPAIP